MLADLNGALHWVVRLKAIAPDAGVHNTAIYSRSATMRVNLIRIPISLSSSYGLPFSGPISLRPIDLPICS
jgi:hypothetical protein